MKIKFNFGQRFKPTDGRQMFVLKEICIAIKIASKNEKLFLKVNKKRKCTIINWKADQIFWYQNWVCLSGYYAKKTITNFEIKTVKFDRTWATKLNCEWPEFKNYILKIGNEIVNNCFSKWKKTIFKFSECMQLHMYTLIGRSVIGWKSSKHEKERPKEKAGENGHRYFKWSMGPLENGLRGR